MKTVYVASRNALKDIEVVAYKGQNPDLRLYKEGYEHFLDNMPILVDSDPFLQMKLDYTRKVMQGLSKQIVEDCWTLKMNVQPGQFKRTIVAIESPIVGEYTGAPSLGARSVKEGVELVVAHWGDQKSSPVHGHSTGFLHEEILHGKMRVNRYRIMDLENKIVRPLKTTIENKGVFLSLHTPDNPENMYKRQTLVHNFTSIGESASLHYLPEHTRDGRDNTFNVQYFEDMNPLTVDNVIRITSKDAMYLPVGEVVMVRSTNVPEYGDHFIIITGSPVMKDHGLRPEDVALPTSPNGYNLLDLYELETGLTLLRLKPEMREKFHEFHGLKVENRQVSFPAE